MQRNAPYKLLDIINFRHADFHNTSSYYYFIYDCMVTPLVSVRILGRFLLSHYLIRKLHARAFGECRKGNPE